MQFVPTSVKNNSRVNEAFKNIIDQAAAIKKFKKLEI